MDNQNEMSLFDQFEYDGQQIAVYRKKDLYLFLRVDSDGTETPVEDEMLEAVFAVFQQRHKEFFA